MSAQPQWESVDNYTSDLLALVALGTAQGDADAEWDCFLAALRTAARDGGGVVDQNVVRPLIRGAIKPCRIGSFYNKACHAGVIEPTGQWSTSDDREGRNAGRPMRTYSWLGGAK